MRSTRRVELALGASSRRSTCSHEPMRRAGRADGTRLRAFSRRTRVPSEWARNASIVCHSSGMPRAGGRLGLHDRRAPLAFAETLQREVRLDRP